MIFPSDIDEVKDCFGYYIKDVLLPLTNKDFLGSIIDIALFVEYCEQRAEKNYNELKDENNKNTNDVAAFAVERENF